MGKSIGIDLGTTNSVVAFKDSTVKIIRNNYKDEELTRSCVELNDKNEFIVGTSPYNNMAKNSPNVIISVKRLMGMSIDDEMVKKMKANSEIYPFKITNLSSGTNEAVAVELQGKEFTPEQISAEILRYLKDCASAKIGEVTHAVITVPAYFTEKQKTATRMAANLAGLKVQRLLAEPTAAAISYGVNNLQPGESKVVLIYDFGGGTFDLSILVMSDGQFIESGTGGNRWLGGDDIDRALQKYVYSKISQQNHINNIDELIKRLQKRKQTKFIDEMRKQIGEAKKQLTISQSAKIELFGLLENEDEDEIDIEVSISRTEFESLIRPLIERTIVLTDELLEKSGYPIDTIDNILLVGGSSCIPLVKQMLSEKYGQDKVLLSEKPMLSVAEGAAILAHSLTEEFECPKCGAIIKSGSSVCDKCGTNVESIAITPVEQKVEVTHTTSHNYYIQVVSNGKETLKKIIENTAVLSLRKEEKFKTSVPNQKIVEIIILADVENGTTEKQMSGFYVIKDNLPIGSELVFTFNMDVNQTLNIQVYPKGGNESPTEIVLGRGNKDSKCLEKISETFKEIENIPDNKKSEFVATVQKIIEDITKIGNKDPESSQWYEIETKIEQAFRIAQEKEDENSNEFPYIFAQILLNNFSKYMDTTDTSDLQRLLKEYNSSTDPIKKQSILIELKEITDNYMILINVFLLKTASDVSKNPTHSNQLAKDFYSAMSALDARDLNSVISTLNNASPLVDEALKGIGGVGLPHNIKLTL